MLYPKSNHMSRYKFHAIFVLWMLTLLLVSKANSQCVTFGEPEDLAVRTMGFFPDEPEWKTVNYVIHIYYTDSISHSNLPLYIVNDAAAHLNEEFEEAMYEFDLLAIEYHDFDEYEDSYALLNTNCIPYNGFAFNSMNDYLEDIVWDRETVMNVHVFPALCQGILGFAWTSYAPQTTLDGVWVKTSVFGRLGDHLLDNRDENKTLIHEVGHFLSLHHVFRNIDNCGQNLGDCEETGDFVCDTPPTKLNWSCENPICPTDWYDYTPDNHMDYYVDSCRQHFTEGQIERMHSMIEITRPGMTTGDPYCAGDISGDLVVGTNDLMLMFSHWGDFNWIEGDLNGDGFFTVGDLQIVLANWGQICFGSELDPFYREEQVRRKSERRF